MKYVITWSVPTEKYVATMTKFLAGGAPPPTGVKMIGRYHGLAGSNSGFIVAETNDLRTIYGWLADWMHLMTFSVVPVVEDAEAAAILSAVKR